MPFLFVGITIPLEVAGRKETMEQHEKRKTVVLTAVITFLTTSLIWMVLLFFVGGSPEGDNPELSVPSQTDAMAEMEASSNVTVYNGKGEWLGNGMLVETSSKAYLRMDNDRYELEPSSVEGYRYIVPEQQLYVK